IDWSFFAIRCLTGLSSLRNSSAASSENSTRNASASLLFDQAFEGDGLPGADLSAGFEDVFKRLCAQAIFERPRDCVPNELRLRRKAQLLRCFGEQAGLFFREFETDRFHWLR